ncbi:unnamed protein product, partial [Amoebophrya sp. A120]
TLRKSSVAPAAARVEHLGSFEKKYDGCLIKVVNVGGRRGNSRIDGHKASLLISTNNTIDAGRAEVFRSGGGRGPRQRSCADEVRPRSASMKTGLCSSGAGVVEVGTYNPERRRSCKKGDAYHTGSPTPAGARKPEGEVDALEPKVEELPEAESRRCTTSYLDLFEEALEPYLMRKHTTRGRTSSFKDGYLFEQTSRPEDETERKMMIEGNKNYYCSREQPEAAADHDDSLTT